MNRTAVTRSVVVFGALALVGLVAIVAAGVAAHGDDRVYKQLPYLVSGVMGGLAMLGFGLALVGIQIGRRNAADERDALDALLRASADWLAATRTGGSGR
jgi:hypothetical protein